MWIEFIKPFAGRKAGTVEQLYDETLARTWIEKGVARELKRGEPEVTEDRAMPEPPRSRSRSRSTRRRRS